MALIDSDDEPISDNDDGDVNEDEEEEEGGWGGGEIEDSSQESDNDKTGQEEVCAQHRSANHWQTGIYLFVFCCRS